MQINEFVAQVQQGTRLPDIDCAINETRAMPESRTERRGADESHRIETRLPEHTRMPRLYGAGF